MKNFIQPTKKLMNLVHKSMKEFKNDLKDQFYFNPFCLTLENLKCVCELIDNCENSSQLLKNYAKK